MPYGNNVNAPVGLVPSQYLNGTTFNGQPNPYSILDNYATSIFTGDPVTWVNNGTIAIGGAGPDAPWLGVFAGCQYVDTFGITQYSPFWKANTRTLGGQLATAFVIDDPNVLWDIQVDDSNAHVHPFVAQSDMFRNANLVIPAGNTSNGLSKAYLDFTTLGTGATKAVKLIRFTPNPLNGPGTAGPPTVYYNNVLVLINDHVFKGGTGTVGSA